MMMMRRMNNILEGALILAIALLLASTGSTKVSAFVPFQTSPVLQASSSSFSSKLYSQPQDDNSPSGTSSSSSSSTTNAAVYSRDVRLREEAESPFRRVRFFLYTALGGGAMTSLVLSLARIAAASSGINSDLMEESLINAGVDLAGLVVLGLLWQRDANAQESRLKRATKGATLAKLAIRVNKAVSDPLYKDAVTSASASSSGDERTNQFTSLTLADLRRDRGIEKRVVIAVAGKDRMQKVLEEARANADALELTDLLIVPVVMPQAISPVEENSSDTKGLPDCVALAVGNAAWRTVLVDECQEAMTQGVDIETEGFCVILKKNGRIGQRTRGIFLNRMVGEVNSRKESGFDVTNI